MRPRKPRIVFIITGLHGGGAETMLFHLLRGMDRDRFDPAVISLMDRGKLGDAIEGLGIPLATAGLRGGRVSPGALLRVVKLTQRARPDVIQGWMYHGNLAAQVAGRLFGAPVCWCVQHSFHSFKAEKPLTRLTIRAAARLSRRPRKIVFVSHASRAQHEQLGFAAERGCVIPNGVDPELFKPSEEARTSVREELGLPREAQLVGLVGRYHPQKDHGTFFRAAAALSLNRRDTHFVLAGAGVDAGNAALAALAGAPSLSGRVHLLGERDDMPRLTAALDVATSSSSYGEALSLAVAEAMACEVPCVVTEVGDSALLVGRSGIVAPPGDDRALAAGWNTLLAAGALARMELGRMARQHVMKHFSMHRIVKKYEELYLSLD